MCNWVCSSDRIDGVAGVGMSYDVKAARRELQTRLDFDSVSVEAENEILEHALNEAYEAGRQQQDKDKEPGDA